LAQSSPPHTICENEMFKDLPVWNIEPKPPFYVPLYCSLHP
jgi:hypothetical protein